MEAQNTIQAQLLAVLQDLPMTRQAEVLDFALFLRDRELAEVWDAIPDDAAAALQAEFAEEDLATAEATMVNCGAWLVNEDNARPEDSPPTTSTPRRRHQFARTGHRLTSLLVQGAEQL